ncbi:MAG: hypothetical protein WD069_14175 [Planctomycetales bacterium]
MARFFRRFLCAAAVIAAMLCAGPARGDDGTAAYFDGLRRLGLFDLAEGYCFEQLGREDLVPERRIEFTIELSRTFAEHAKYTAGGEQDDLWRRSLDVLDEFAKEYADDPRSVEVRTQAALARATQGEYLRWQAELLAHDEGLARRADAALAQASARLAEIEKVLDARFAAVRAARGPKDGPSALRLRTLLENVRYRQAVALLDRAKLKPRGDSDRAAWLLDAEQRLRRLSGAIDGQELAWHSRVLLAEGLRLGGEPERGGNVLADLLKQEIPAGVQERVVAQQALIALDLGRPDETERILAEHQAARGALPGELRFLRVQGLIGSWEAARAREKGKLADELLESIEQYVARAEREVGGLWGYRCRTLLDYAREADRFGPELARTIRRAQALYADQRIDDALAAYERAYRQAQAAGRPDAAMEAGYVRASIAAQAERYAEAADQFRELAENYPTHERAAAAHLLAAWSVGRMFDKEPSAARRLAYECSLTDHAARFPEDASRFDALWMLAGLREREGQLDQAWAIYRKIPADHPRGPAAQGAVARCYEQIIDRLRAAGRDAAEWERSAEDVLGGYVEQFPDLEQPLGPQQAEVALRFAKILLDRDQPDYEGAELLLRRTVTSWNGISSAKGGVAADVVAAWKPILHAAAQWRIVALAGRGRMAEAEQLVAELSGLGTEEVLAVLDGITQLTSRANAQTRRGLGEVQLQAALQLDMRRSELTAWEQSRLDRCLAQAYVATNQPKRATEVYESLLARLPKDKGLLRTAAFLELECGTKECLQFAKKNWRALESLEPPGSDGWMEARYHLVLALHRLGEDAAARKLAGVAQLLYPDRGSAEVRLKLAALRAELGPD